MQAWQRRRIDLINVLKNACGILFQIRINARPIYHSVTGWFCRRNRLLLKPSRYYSYGCRVLNVLHTRLRHRSSNLNADLFRVNLINDPGCVCGWVIEDAIHFFLECCLYVEAREQLTNNLQFLDSLLIETLLFGDDSLSEEQNAQIFKSVQLYIKQTKRFTPQWSHFIYWI